MWFGFAMGYVYHYGLLNRIMIGAERATRFESKFPFKVFKEKPYFITAGDAMGGTISGGAVMSGPMGGTAREANADNESGTSTAAGNNSVSANFKAFSGKGQSIGGNALPAEPPRFNSQGASASRGRSTPETRAASAASTASTSSSGAPGNQRQGSALIAKLEEKKRKEKKEANTSALTTDETDVGHEMEP